MRLFLIFVLFQVLTFNYFAQCWKEVKSYGSNNIALKEDGSMWSWGVNYFGELGTYYETSYSNTFKFTQQVGRDIDWQSIGVGEYFTLAIKKNGTLWSFGNNNFGQLGVGNYITKSNEPLQIGQDSDWIQIATGREHCVALKKDGTVWVWGRNNAGQLGLGHNIDEFVPKQIQLNAAITSVYASEYASFIKEFNGKIHSFGTNDLGQLGLSNNSSKNIPTPIGLPFFFDQLFCGYNFLFAINKEQVIHVWGHNINKVLSTSGSNFTSVNYPIVFGNNSYISFAGGEQHALGIKNDKTLWSWGGNTFGQLGINTTSPSIVPIKIGEENNWKKVSCGTNSSFAINELGELWVCGHNNSSNLTNSASQNQKKFVKVECPKTVLRENIFFPNPVQDIFYFQFEENSTVFHVEVFDLYSKLRLIDYYPSNSVDLSSLNPGVYVLQFNVDGFFYQHKVIKI
jgi:alpha-tubulin suppressor-like RCC1 family protein